EGLFDFSNKPTTRYTTNLLGRQPRSLNRFRSYPGYGVDGPSANRITPSLSQEPAWLTGELVGPRSVPLIAKREAA
ncbi:MAG: hypothetical protein KDA83_11780, partial [Planctomycetales bacterium]|nr:hypothetical protein [Planctomycetales bacterium]